MSPVPIDSRDGGVRSTEEWPETLGAHQATVAAPAILVDDLCKTYGTLRAVDGLSFRVERGEIYAVLGPNGAGKTTTVEILEGHRRHTSGLVRVLGHDPSRRGRRLRERVGIVLQAGGLDGELTVAELVALYGSFLARHARCGALLGEHAGTQRLQRT